MTIRGSDARRLNWEEERKTTGHQTRGQRTEYKGHPTNVTKYDLIRFIEDHPDLFPIEGNRETKPRRRAGIPRQPQLFRYGDKGVDLTEDPAEIIGDVMGVELPANCLSKVNFHFTNDVDPIVDLPVGIDRLWSTSVGLDPPSNDTASFAMFRGLGLVTSAMHKEEKRVTIIAQNLGNTETYAAMLSAAVQKFSDTVRNTPLYAAAAEHVRSENIPASKMWTCRAINEEQSIVAFTMIDGWWESSLELMADRLEEMEAEHERSDVRSFTVTSVLCPIITHVTQATLPTSTAGRDTLHYAWKFDRDSEGKEWLTIGILPLAYYYHDLDPYKPLNVEKLVRNALMKRGTMLIELY